jgi:hypothetical protein
MKDERVVEMVQRLDTEYRTRWWIRNGVDNPEDAKLLGKAVGIVPPDQAPAIVIAFYAGRGEPK